PTGRGRLRSHQRSSELVAALDAASDKEAVFLYIVGFLKAGMNLFAKVRSRFFFIFISYFCDLFSASFPIITKPITTTLVRPLIFPCGYWFFESSNYHKKYQ
ncbi:MAG: hypothetical protein IJO02_03215, partial [Clostridia bacterium]|nr:hypothetical protein [Clostridia bacterium]